MRLGELTAGEAPSDLVLLGFIAMTDPPRDGVEDAIARCHRAGIRVVMVTGDHALTASAIASRIGLTFADEGGGKLSGCGRPELGQFQMTLLGDLRSSQTACHVLGGTLCGGAEKSRSVVRPRPDKHSDVGFCCGRQEE